MDNSELFNFYLKCIIEFSQQFDPTEILMEIANDQYKRDYILNAPDDFVNLEYVENELWPKIGFLPFD